MGLYEKEFSELGFDLLGLKKLIYLGLDPDEEDDCTGGFCTDGCQNGCKSCIPGNK